MAGISLAQAQTQLDAYLAAEIAILGSQSYEIAGRKLTRADLQMVQEGIKTWSARVSVLTSRSNGRSRSRTVVVGG